MVEFLIKRELTKDLNFCVIVKNDLKAVLGFKIEFSWYKKLSLVTKNEFNCYQNCYK